MLISIALLSSALLPLASAVALPSPELALADAHASSHSRRSLLVTDVPQSERPYAIRDYDGVAVQVGQQVYRFPVTGNSSNGAFTLIVTGAPASDQLGVFPHIHETHYENFYCSKGRINLWSQSNSTTASGGQQQARILTQGDYGAVPRDTIHTFQTVDPDTELTGVIQPGGFEALFFAIGSLLNSSTRDAFIPSNNVPSAGGSPAQLAALTVFDVYTTLDFQPTYAFGTNGAFPASSTWHNGTNTIPTNGHTPYFIAKNYGPLYQTKDQVTGAYTIIAPLVTAKSGGGNFTQGTFTFSKPAPCTKPPTAKTFKQPFAFRVQEGALVACVAGYQSATLITGDTLYVPANTKVTFYAAVQFTKVLYVSKGANGIDADYLSGANSTQFATYPLNY